MKQTLSWNDSTVILDLTVALRRGSVIAGSSDTILGLLADLTVTGFAELNRVKGRFEKPYLILIADAKKLTHFVELPLSGDVHRLVERCWPGPLTIIFKAKKSVPHFMKSADGTIAVRVPRHDGLQALLAHFNGLFSTSANKTGEKVAATVADLDPALANAVAYVVADDVTPESKPSTIIDATGKELRVVREGAYPVSALEKIVGYHIEKAA